MNESTLSSEHALMRLTLELAWLIESADDETLDLRTAVKWLEVWPTASTLSRRTRDSG